MRWNLAVAGLAFAWGFISVIAVGVDLGPLPLTVFRIALAAVAILVVLALSGHLGLLRVPSDRALLALSGAFLGVHWWAYFETIKALATGRRRRDLRRARALDQDPYRAAARAHDHVLAVPGRARDAAAVPACERPRPADGRGVALGRPPRRRLHRPLRFRLHLAARAREGAGNRDPLLHRARLCRAPHM